ncbi:MAG: hypothetical protein ACE5ID_02020 [Acidobacteriota bacterium]
MKHSLRNPLPTALAWLCERLPDRRLAGRESVTAYADMQRNHAKTSLLPYLRAHARVDNALILDIGCGLGGATDLYASLGSDLTVGIDINPQLLLDGAMGQHTAAHFAAADVCHLPFLHDPARALLEIRRVMKPGACIVLNFPSWRGPWGHHIYDFLPVPWINLFFSTKVLVEAINERARCRIAAGDNREWVETWREKTVTQFVHGLNRMTVRRLRRTLLDTGPWGVRNMTVGYWTRWAKPLGIFPPLAEMFTRRIDVAIEKVQVGRTRLPVASAFRRPGMEVLMRRLRPSGAG